MSSATATKQHKASNFAMTCNLLSQFIKDKGSLGDLGLGLATGRSDTYRPPTTMNLLSALDASATDTKETVSERNDVKSVESFLQRIRTPEAADRKPEGSQLTIIYGGKVMVFDNFPADKAKDLMTLAGSGSGVPVSNFSGPKNLNLDLNSNYVPQSAVASVMQPRLAADLPIARKASLHRFFEKRKDRINAKAPYQVHQKKDYPANIGDNQPWLALNPDLNTKLQ